MENNLENNKIKVVELIAKLQQRTSQNAKDLMFKTIKFKNYIPFVTKDISAKQIIESSHLTYPKGTDLTLPLDELNKIEQVPMLNHSRQYVLSAITLIDLYTNIQLDFTNAVFEYDMLCEYGVIEYILSNIPETEIKEFKMLIDYQYDIFYEKYFSVKSYIDNKMKELQAMLSFMIKFATNEIKNIDVESNVFKDVKNLLNNND